jgi:hypothetical protein
MINKMVLKMSGDTVSPGNILTATYSIPGNKLRILISESEFVEVPSNSKEQPQGMVFGFGRKRSEYTFEYNSDLDTQDDKDRKNVIEKFWMQHPLLTINGKSTAFTKNPIYDMYSEKEKVHESYDAWQMGIDVSNRVANMSIERLRDAMYYYGIDPSGYSKQQMVVKLAGIDGVATKDINPNTKENNFLRVWSEEGPADRDFLTNVKKAIFHKIVDLRKDGSRNLYYFGDEFIGHAESDVLAFLKREQKLYESNILPRIAAAEKNIFGASTAAKDPQRSVINKEKSAEKPAAPKAPEAPNGPGAMSVNPLELGAK